ARGSIVRSLKKLNRLVTVMAGDPSRHLASHYRINIEISHKELVTLRDQTLVLKSDQGLVTKRDQELVSLPSLKKRPSKEIPKKEDNKRDGADAPGFLSAQQEKKSIPEKPPLPEWLEPSLWEEFREHRKALKAKLTPQAEKLSLRTL